MTQRNNMLNLEIFLWFMLEWRMWFKFTRNKAMYNINKNHAHKLHECARWNENATTLYFGKTFFKLLYLPLNWLISLMIGLNISYDDKELQVMFFLCLQYYMLYIWIQHHTNEIKWNEPIILWKYDVVQMKMQIFTICYHQMRYHE